MSIKNNVENQSGIYGLGFNLWSFLGISFPVAFVAIIGGLLVLLLVM